MNDAEAPDFTPGYPSQGAMIAPAWRAAWHLLADGQARPFLEIAGVMVRKSGIQATTARHLLRQARRRGLLAVSYAGRTRAAHYRRVDV